VRAQAGGEETVGETYGDYTIDDLEQATRDIENVSLEFVKEFSNNYTIF
jgi:hypothetical protein